MKPTTLLFDVNETMLDLSVMKPVFAEQLGDDSLVADWFSMMLRYSLEVTVIDDHRPFGELARSALMVTAEQAGLQVSDVAIQTVTATMTKLPAHPDVAPALARLAESGFTMATLSNSSLDAVTDQLTHAGLIQFFERQISVDDVNAFKPDPRTYHYAVEQMGATPADTMLIAAHDWDVNGALRAGLQAAFVDRPSATHAPHATLPDVQRPTMTGIADALLETAS